MEWLAFFNVSLSGTVPTELGALAKLLLLDLRHTQLSGSIPPELHFIYGIPSTVSGRDAGIRGKLHSSEKRSFDPNLFLTPTNYAIVSLCPLLLVGCNASDTKTDCTWVFTV
jgi:hypothetical protein